MCLVFECPYKAARNAFGFWGLTIRQEMIGSFRLLVLISHILGGE
jgi:hypothetical protein